MSVLLCISLFSQATVRKFCAFTLPLCLAFHTVTWKMPHWQGTTCQREQHANLWAIHRDPIAWGDDSLLFNPARFLGASGLTVNGTNHQFLPFGAGRRICPGRALAMRALSVAVGSLVHAFEWSEALPGAGLNADEGTTGVNIRPETPLLLRISFRPPSTLYQSAPNADSGV